jgi:hypothetical protein
MKSWKVPITVAATNVPMVALPGTCRPLGPAVGTAAAKSQDHSYAGGLSGEVDAISYPRFNPSISTLVHFIRLSGETHSEVLSPDKKAWIVPDMALSDRGFLDVWVASTLIACTQTLLDEVESSR